MKAAQRRPARRSQCSCKRFIEFSDRQLRRGYEALPRLSVQAAACLDAAHRNGHHCESTRHIAELVGIRLEVAQTRMAAALKRGYARWMSKLLQNRDCSLLICGTAYYRDLIMQLSLTVLRATAGHPELAAHIEKLRDFWERVDKGDLARGEPERQALIFLRKLDLLKKCTPPPNEKQCTTEQAELSKFLLDACKNEQCDFELALAKAKRFRATKEGNLRAQLFFWGVIASLFGERFPDSETLMKNFDPARYATLQDALKRGKKGEERARNIKRNWRKFLDKSLIMRLTAVDGSIRPVALRTEKKSGRPRKRGTVAV